jgi:peptidoglycan-associated lipoprotein
MVQHWHSVQNKYLKCGALIFLLNLAACSTPVQLDKPTIDDRSTQSSSLPVVSDSAVVPIMPTVIPNVVESPQLIPTQIEADQLNDPNGPLAKRKIYFEYNQYDIQNEYKPVIESHAQYLIKNTKRKVVIEGNADERGGREYNLALGQKRAEAVRKALQTLGVNDAQMEATSWGEEKPANSGKNEAAYAENRRADIVYR